MVPGVSIRPHCNFMGYIDSQNEWNINIHKTHSIISCIFYPKIKKTRLQLTIEDVWQHDHLFEINTTKNTI